MVFNQSIVYYLIIINILSFFMIFIDKNKARMGTYRISEKILLTSSLIGGSIGTIMSMYIFHHKTRKARFKYGLPIIIILQVSLYCLKVFYGN